MRDTSGQDKVLQKSGMPYQKTIVFVVVLLLVVALVAYVLPTLSRVFSADYTISVQQVRLATVQRGTLQSDIAVQGRIIAANSPTLFAPAAGTVSLQVKAGDQVEQGQVLASLYSPDLVSRLSQEQATFEQLSIEVGRHKIQMKTSLLNNQQSIELTLVNFEVAQVEKQRAQTSIKENLISQRELEERIASYKRSELAYRHAVQNNDLQKESMAFDLQSKESQRNQQALVVDNLTRQVSDLNIVSPTEGIIGSVNIREKDQVSINQPLITVIDLSIFEVEVNIPETYADDLGLGLLAEISFNGQLYKGELTAISPEVANGQVSGRIRFKQTDIAGLRQNQRVSARVLIESKANVLKIKRGAFIETGGSRIAYRVNEQSASKVAITLGLSSVGEIEVLSGLNEGDQIIVSSVSQFNGSELINLTK